jgi:hypothetical protein
MNKEYGNQVVQLRMLRKYDFGNFNYYFIIAVPWKMSLRDLCRIDSQSI